MSNTQKCQHFVGSDLHWCYFPHWLILNSVEDSTHRSPRGLRVWHCDGPSTGAYNVGLYATTSPSVDCF